MQSLRHVWLFQANLHTASEVGAVNLTQLPCTLNGVLASSMILDTGAVPTMIGPQFWTKLQKSTQPLPEVVPGGLRMLGISGDAAFDKLAAPLELVLNAGDSATYTSVWTAPVILRTANAPDLILGTATMHRLGVSIQPGAAVAHYCRRPWDKDSPQLPIPLLVTPGFLSSTPSWPRIVASTVPPREDPRDPSRVVVECGDVESNPGPLLQLASRAAAAVSPRTETCIARHPLLPWALLACGDVEPNPGPPIRVSRKTLAEWLLVVLLLTTVDARWFPPPRSWRPRHLRLWVAVVASIVRGLWRLVLQWRPDPWLHWWLPACGDVERHPGPPAPALRGSGGPGPGGDGDGDGSYSPAPPSPTPTIEERCRQLTPLPYQLTYKLDLERAVSDQGEGVVAVYLCAGLLSSLDGDLRAGVHFHRVYICERNRKLHPPMQQFLRELCEEYPQQLSKEAVQDAFMWAEAIDHDVAQLSAQYLLDNTDRPPD